MPAAAAIRGSIAMPSLQQSTRMYNRRLFLLASLLTALPCTAGELVVPFATYYDYAPFYSPDGSADLTHDLAALLTRESGGRYRFEPMLLPKKRIDNMLQHQNWQGVVAWSSPRFFYDESKVRYLWTDALLQESALVVSHIDAPVDFKGLESLRGKVLGTILNQRYVDVEDMIANQQLRRSDAPSMESNIRKLLLKRVDVVFISRSALGGLRHRIPGADNQLYIAAQPRDQFTRNLMLTRDLPPDVISYVQRMAAQLDHNPAWRDILVRHHVEGLAAPRR
jgi:polar amino acid transport system substrate-binding protein